MGDFAGLSPWRASTGPMPPYPTPSNTLDGEPPPVRRERPAAETAGDDDVREELRQIIIEELHDLIGGGRGG
jgi:hypothetical protein